MLTPLRPEQATIVTWRDSRKSSGRQYQRPRKRTLPFALRHMAFKSTAFHRP